MRPRPQREGESDQDYRSMVAEMDRKWREGQIGPKRSEVVTRPTRNLRDTLTRPEGGDTDAWNRGDLRGNEPREYSSGYFPRPKREWWEEPRRPSPGRGGEIGRGLDTDEDRVSLLTGGRGLGGGGSSPSSLEERMKLLTGSTDPVSKPWQSQYGGREEYDPQDRKFNRQFDERPKGPQPWDSSPRNDRWGSRIGQTGPGTMDYIDSDGDKTDDRYQTGPGAPKASPAYDDSALRKRLAALEARGPIVNQPTQDLSGIQKRLQDLEGRPQSTGGWQEDRIKALENRPQGTGGNWNETRIAALEGRKPQDLSGITGRISELEGKKPSWQEERVKALEGRQPSWQEERVKALEGRQDDTSWKDPLSQVQAGQQAGQQARSALDTRLGALENYYKNDPPPEDSVGNRYEDKLANLNKMWEQQGSSWDKVKDKVRFPDSSDDRKWSQFGVAGWAKGLPNPYVQQVRDLQKEYNKPQHTAIIKGREYKAYGPRATERLKHLDTHDIHEDQYLGSGTWKNQYGEDVSGWGRGNEDRYFASQSGLDKDSDDYKMRFRGNYQYWTPGDTWAGQSSDEIMKYLKEKDYGSGKDFAYYD